MIIADKQNMLEQIFTLQICTLQIMQKVACSNKSLLRRSKTSLKLLFVMQPLTNLCFEETKLLGSNDK